MRKPIIIGLVIAIIIMVALPIVQSSVMPTSGVAQANVWRDCCHYGNPGCCFIVLIMMWEDGNGPWPF